MPAVICCLDRGYGSDIRLDIGGLYGWRSHRPGWTHSWPIDTLDIPVGGLGIGYRLTHRCSGIRDEASVGYTAGE